MTRKNLLKMLPAPPSLAADLTSPQAGNPPTAPAFLDLPAGDRFDTKFISEVEAVAGGNAALADEILERAAVREFEGGLSRAEAERLALAEARPSRLQITIAVTTRTGRLRECLYDDCSGTPKLTTDGLWECPGCQHRFRVTKASDREWRRLEMVMGDSLRRWPDATDCPQGSVPVTVREMDELLADDRCPECGSDGINLQSRSPRVVWCPTGRHFLEESKQ